MYFLLYMVGLVWFGLLCLTPLSTIFQLYIVAVSFIGGGNRRRKPQACRKSLTNSYHIMLYQVHLAWAGFELTLVVIGTNYIGSCKSNYHTTTPFYIRHIMVHIFFFTLVYLKGILKLISVTFCISWKLAIGSINDIYETLTRFL